MIIDFSTLQDGVHKVDWTGEIPGVDLIYPEIVAAIQVRAKIHRLQEVVTIRAALRAQLERPCDRCLRPAVLAIESSLYVVAKLRTGLSAAEMGDDGEVLISVDREESMVDLTDHIRESLIVEVPMTILCGDDCKGLCPQCGADLNEESCSCRWQSE